MAKKHLNIILANSLINSGNRGCVALTVSSIYIIDSLFDNTEKSYTLYVLDSNIEIENYYIKQTLSIGNKKIEYYPIPYPIGVDAKGTAMIFIRNHFFSSLSVMLKADIILDLGQGDSFADIYGKRRFLIIDRIHKVARYLHKKYCFLPQTIGPFSNEKILKKAKKSLNRSSLVMARDKESYNYVKIVLPKQNKVAEYIDVAFMLPYQTIKQNRSYTHVGLNISALLWNGGYTRDNQFGLSCDYKKLILYIIDYFLKQPHTKVHLIPHVVLQERNVENDYEVCFDLWREYNTPNLVLAPFAIGPMEIKSYISGMDFFMGARMHATIAAFSSGVPVIPMAYSRKFNGLYEETLQYDYIVDLKKDSFDDIQAKIINSFENRKTLSEIIDERLKDVVEDRKKKLTNDLKSLILQQL